MRTDRLKFELPRIYPITDTRLTNLSHGEQVKILIESGARFIQLREKYVSPKKFFADARTAMELARQHSAKIIINDRVDIALALKADGVHLGQDDLPPVEARKILGEKAIIGYSTHNLEQALKAVQMPIDYLAIGPVFATQTKENPDEIVSLEQVKKIREAVGDFPLVAIGGINKENFHRVFETGIRSLSIIKGILFPPELIKENFTLFSQSG